MTPILNLDLMHHAAARHQLPSDLRRTLRREARLRRVAAVRRSAESIGAVAGRLSRAIALFVLTGTTRPAD